MSDRNIKIADLPLTGEVKLLTEGEKFLRVEVNHQKGGTSWMSGNSYPGGYYVSAQIITLRDGTMSCLLMGDQGIEALLETAPRFNAKRLRQLADGAMGHAKTQEVIAWVLSHNPTVQLAAGKTVAV